MKQVFLALTLAAVFSAGAASRYAITYQSVLRDEHGEAFDRSHREFDVEFRLYRTSDLAEALWGRKIRVRLDEEGLFNVLLENGAGVPITSEPVPLYESLSNVYSAVTSGDLFLGVKPVDAVEELRPRQKVLSAPNAVWAYDVAHAPGDFSVGGTASAKQLVAPRAHRARGVQAARMTVSGDLDSGGRLTVTDGFTAQGAASVTGNSRISGGLKAEAALQADRLTASGVTAGSVSSGSLNVQSISVNGGNPIAPRGLIVMWYGDKAGIPAGWALCDGNNGTPDLRDRFPVGAGGTYAKGATGGANTVRLELSQIPQHSHAYSFYHSGYKLAWNDSNKVTTDTKGDTYSKTTRAVGNGEAHENRPRFKAVYYIMKIR